MRMERYVQTMSTPNTVTAGTLRQHLWALHGTHQPTVGNTSLCTTLVWYNVLPLNNSEQVTGVWKRNLPEYCADFIRVTFEQDRRGQLP